MRSLNIATVSADTSAFAWRKSSRSAANGACVEVAQLPGQRVVVRDSKNPAGAPMMLSARDWSNFIGDIKNGTPGN
jgi:Domain of unknown function (DUF397)